MFRLLTLVLAFALYGVYSFFNLGTDKSGAPDGASLVAARAISAASGESGETESPGLVSVLASSMLGIRVLPMPDSGCSLSALPPDRAMALLGSLPDAQQLALAKMLNASSTVWTVQLYTGELGTGFCLPAQDKLVLLPSGASAASDGVSGLVQSFTDSIPH